MRLALLVALAAAPAAAAVGGQTLRRPVSARVSGLSEAFAAAGGGLSSFGVNPAGLAAETKTRLETSFRSGVLDDRFGFLGFARPVAKAGVAAAGLVYYDAGPVELVAQDGTAQTKTAARDYVASFAWAMPLGGGLSAGALGKAFRLELAEAASAAGAAADAGLRWETPLKGLALGGAVQNAGPGIKFEQETEDLPLTLRGGAAWTLSALPERDVEATFSKLTLTLTGDAIKVRDEEIIGALGAEFSLEFGTAVVNLRAGGMLNREGAGPSFGAGVGEGRFSIDYGMAQRRQLGATHHVSLGVRF